MDLHVPTLLAALVAGYLTLTLQLALVHPRVRQQPGVRRWVAGSWAILLGFGLMGLRPWVPLPLSIVLGNGLLLAGLGLYHQALQQHLGASRPSRWPLTLQPVVWVLLIAATQMSHERRTVLVSMLVLVMAAGLLNLLWRRGWAAERSLRAVTLTVAAATVAMAVRAGDAVLHPQAYQSLMQGSLGQGLTFLTAFLGVLGAGFGFVLAVFERVANRMEELASHDGLTGCFNRVTCDALLEHALALARREGTSMAFVLLDLDDFKQVNDRHGHRVGDEVLRRFAQAARQRLRAADVIGRTGGEEFGLVLPATDAPGAMRLVEEVRQATQTLGVTDAQGRVLQVTVSAGVAVSMPDEEISADRLYGRADQALYEAKHAGRNRVELFGDQNRRQRTLLPEEPESAPAPRQIGEAQRAPLAHPASASAAASVAAQVPAPPAPATSAPAAAD